MMVEAINNLKGPTAPTQAALMITLGHLDHMDYMVKVHSCYEGCGSQFPTRRKELHQVLKKWNNHMKLPIILFIADERIKESAGTATLRGLIASLQAFLTTEIHERMTAPISASGKTVVLATTTGCKLHGENAKHTTAECKGIKRKHEHDGGSNAKGKRPMNERQERKIGFNAAAVTADQDMRSGYRPGYQKGKSTSSKQATRPSNGGHHGGSYRSNSGQPRQAGGSLEELMKNSMKGGYRGNNFDPAKSAKCQALIAHLQNGG
jgi:hypothetical protein